jgi:hypothetical protein
MESGDVFCGNCGTPSPPALTGAGDVPMGNGQRTGLARAAVRTVPPPSPPPPDPVPSGPFFSHSRSRPAGRMTNATRYLCAAAYLNPVYTYTVIRELVSSNRAVAPSVGIDLAPIMRHCLRARNLQLARDIVLSVLLLIGLFVATGVTLGLLALCFLIGFLPSVNWARKSMRYKIAAIVGSIAVVGGTLALLFVIYVIVFIGSILHGLTSSNDTFGGTAPAPSGLSGLLLAIVLVGPGLVVAMAATQVVYTYVGSRTLCDELGPDARPRRPRTHGQLVESRIAQVEAAQNGNVLLYSGPNPFIGTGDRTRAWSIAVELRGPGDRDRRESSQRPRRPGAYVSIDPVELHQVIRARLLNLKDGALPPNEQLQALTVQDHIVGLGQHRWDSPLIDPATSVPYSEASQEAVHAMIRHPQGGVRYYQRMSVCDEGQPIWSGQRKVMDGSDQDISASAFVYAAVEGHMFYLEFVSTAMPPIDPHFHLVDLLPKVTPGRFMARVLQDAFSSIFRDLIYSPVQAVRSLKAIAREGRTYQEQSAAAQEYLYGNVGARVSVRELGAARNFVNYIQRLDAEKYTKLTERLVTDTVLEFLASKGVDTSAYESGITNMIDQSISIHGDNHGAVASGDRASARHSSTPQRDHG